ncbi:hypothetical protein FI667_g845, partial [Globisporangium splendens]
MAISKTADQHEAIRGAPPSATDVALLSTDASQCSKLDLNFFGVHDGPTSTSITANDAHVEVPPATVDQVVESITKDMIGRNALFETPFGTKAQCYADFTASGKPLTCVEEYVQKEVLPLYGNTHTSTSITGLQMTSFREDARRIIADAVNAKISGPDPTDCVLFTGQGTTSAINKLVALLDLPRLGADKNPEQRPVVFVGPFEHHSNLLPWRESGAKVVMIPENDEGVVDIMELRRALEQHAHHPFKLGAFSAASNLTGVLSDVDAISMVLHQHDALAFFDYATCGPYVKIDMNPEFPEAGGAGEFLAQFVYKDAVYMSGHKFIGGPGATGLLVVKANLTTLKDTPTAPGGGTVLYVTHEDHKYVSHATEREEGGTPDILGNIRLGLAFQVKQRVGTQAILDLEKMNLFRVSGSLANNDNVVLLGRGDIERLPIFSFLVRFGDRFLHYNFVCALLNDLFGIQTRGGCQCAGPYAARLLGIVESDLVQFKTALSDHQEALKPGFTRMSFPYFMDASEVDYILRAVHFVANEGWKFLPQYRFDAKTGAWTHILRLSYSFDTKKLQEFVELLEDSGLLGTRATTRATLSGTERWSDTEPTFNVAKHRADNFTLAKKIAAFSISNCDTLEADAQQRLDASCESLRWFAYPQDAVSLIVRGESPQRTDTVVGPCQPQRYSPSAKEKSSSKSEKNPGKQTGAAKARSVWGRSNTYSFETTYSSNPNKTGNYSKRAAMKGWMKRVLVRSHSALSSSDRHSAIEYRSTPALM